MDSKNLLERILQKEGASEAFEQLKTQFNINDTLYLEQNWADIENLLVNFKLKRYRISQDNIFSEIIIQPFKSQEELQQLKKYLLN